MDDEIKIPTEPNDIVSFPPDNYLLNGQTQHIINCIMDLFAQAYKAGVNNAGQYLWNGGENQKWIVLSSSNQL